MHPPVFTIDLHCHPSMKSFNSGHPKPMASMWENIEHTLANRFATRINNLSPHIFKGSQCNLNILAEGDVRIFNVSIYPIERGFLHLRNVPQALIGKNKIDTLQEVITGFNVDRIRHLKTHYSYFEDLVAEYEYVFNQQGTGPDGNTKFILANNYEELEAALKEKNTLIGIISIEGAHCLGVGTLKSEDKTEEELVALLTENIAKIKQWEFPPFTINLSHHFWNQLSGHATSFKPPINAVVNQNKGKDKGITTLGWHVIREFLSKENGKRILIDTKHMSAAARKEFCEFVYNYNYINPNDKIPLVVSHAAMNGMSTLESSIRDNDVPAKARKHRLYRWSINVPNDEIRYVHHSEGLIGLMMDRGNLGGLDTIKEIVEITDDSRKRAAYAKLFWDNAFQAVKAVGDQSGWDVLAFGSDFDGTITHVEPYHSAATIPTFQHDLIDYLTTTNYQKELWYDYTPADLVRKIMHENAMRFYKKFFV